MTIRPIGCGWTLRIMVDKAAQPSLYGKDTIMADKQFIKRGFAVFAAAAGLAGVLTGCGGPSLSGHTYYSISAIDGDESSISFDGDAWKMTEGDNWYSGTWTQAENGSITLDESRGETITLNPIEGSDGYQYAGEEKLGTRFYPSKEEAQDATQEFTENLPNTVMDYLEAANWKKEVSAGGSCQQSETIAFKDGNASFTKGVYDQKGYIFHQGPNDGEWGASDHSGEYAVTVDQFSIVETSDNPKFIGTITIGGAETTYKLEVLSDSLRLTLDKDNTTDLTFTAE